MESTTSTLDLVDGCLKFDTPSGSTYPYFTLARDFSQVIVKAGVMDSIFTNPVAGDVLFDAAAGKAISHMIFCGDDLEGVSTFGEFSMTNDTESVISADTQPATSGNNSSSTWSSRPVTISSDSYLADSWQAGLALVQLESSDPEFAPVCNVGADKIGRTDVYQIVIRNCSDADGWLMSFELGTITVVTSADEVTTTTVEPTTTSVVEIGRAHV